MSRPRLPTVVCLAVALSAAVVTEPPALAQPLTRRYAITTLPMDDYDSLHVNGINEHGHVVGFRIKSEVRYAFFWSSQTGMLDLGVFNTAGSISNADVVRGWRDVPGSPRLPFQWSAADGYHLLLNYQGLPQFNEAGQVLERLSNPFQRPETLVLHNPNGTRRVLPLPPGTSSVTSSGLAVDGTATGWVRVRDEDREHTRGILWPASGGYRFLAGLPGWEKYSFGGQMNSQGTIVGQAGVPDVDPIHAIQRAVYWDADLNVHDMGTLPGRLFSGTAGINEKGEIVGWSAGNTGSGDIPWHGFVFTTAEGMLDLNDLIDNPGLCWHIRHAHDINDAGQITASAMFEGRQTGIILTPIPWADANAPATPEPSALLLVAGAALLVSRRR